MEMIWARLQPGFSSRVKGWDPSREWSEKVVILTYAELLIPILKHPDGFARLTIASRHARGELIPSTRLVRVNEQLRNGKMTILMHETKFVRDEHLIW